MSHYILKLTSGDIVYGIIDLDKTDKKMVVLENPLTWEDYETEDGRVGSALVKYMTGTDETKIPIATSSIVSMCTMSEKFTNYYEAAAACQAITDEAYAEKLVQMTNRMIELVQDYRAKEAVEELGPDALVAYKTDTNTIH
jgi:hypothetical protein